MSKLSAEGCVACRAGAPRLTCEELESVRGEIPDWEVVVRDGIERLERTYKVPDFRAALKLTEKIGDAAEREGHHPAILLEWGRVTVTWWTHKIRGLHRNDVVMAAKTDDIARGTITAT